MQDEALDEHPQEHGRLAVLDQGVERLAEEGLQRTWDVVMKHSHTKASRCPPLAFEKSETFNFFC